MTEDEDDTIYEVRTSEDGNCPVLASFQNSKLQIGGEQKLKTKFYKNGKNQTVITAKTRDMLYTGVVKQSDKLYRKFLLIRSKSSGKVRLVELESAVLSPYFDNVEIGEDVVESPEAREAIKTLSKQFGSKRTKRITEQRERMTMNVENIKEQLENTVANMEFDEAELMQANQIDENDSNYRPSINREATRKEDVYNLIDLVPFNVLNSLQEQAEQTLNSDLDPNVLCPVIYQEILKLKNTTKNLEKSKLLLLVNYLISFVVKPARLLTNKRVQICKIPYVNHYILDNFTIVSNTGRTRPLSMRDKAICYILVLLMIGANYEIDIECLSKDIKVGLKKLQEICRVLAFSPYSSKHKSIFVLKLPLPPPVAAAARNKRKR